MARNDPPVVLSDDELADGIWLAFENACRLVDDGKTLIEASRYLSAQGVLRIAVEEGGKVLLLSQAIYWEKTDSEKWIWFWKTWASHKRKLRLIEFLYHWPTYQDRKRFDETIKSLLDSRLELWYVDYDKEHHAYRAPQIHHATDAEAAEATQVELKYTMTLLTSLLPATGGSRAGLRRQIPEIRSTRRDAMDWPPPDFGSDEE